MMREGEHGQPFDRSSTTRASRSRACPTTAGSPRRASRRWEASRSSTSTGSSDHLDDVGHAPRPAPRADDHPGLSSGFVDLAVPRDLGGPPATRLRPDHRPSAGILYTIPSLAAFAVPAPDLRALADHGDHPADDLHAADPRPQQRVGLRGGAGRRPRGGRGDGLHAPGAAAPGRAAAGGAADDRGHPARERHDDRPGDRRGDPRRLVRRARPVHHRGPPELLPDQDLPRARSCRSRSRSRPTSCSSGSSGV